MSVIVSDDELSDDSFSDCSQFSPNRDEEISQDTQSDIFKNTNNQPTNIAINLANRQIYGRFTKNPKAKTDKVFSGVHPRCRINLSSLLSSPDLFNHIFMGFTLCGQFFLSFTQNSVTNNILNFGYEYELYVWRFTPGQKLKFVSKHRIFKRDSSIVVLGQILFLQFPMDPYKLLCYGIAHTTPATVFVTILTLPFPKSCKHCYKSLNVVGKKHGWCVKHGFILHYMFTMSQPCPVFDPHISLSFPDHLIINTGHYIHILNVTTLEPPKQTINKEKDIATPAPSLCNFNDTLSELSETPSDNFGTSSVVEAILEDFNEYDLEGQDCNKPFHELNISCEPLNVTGKNYHNTLIQNIIDPRIKRVQSNTKDYIFPQPSIQKPVEKKIDKKTAEKAYEFIEENEKCEKLSSFRKKRLAEKKYEFSEDNSENIVPFNSLRRERRFFRQNRFKNADFNSLFLSPRSPMQSPNSRNGQFSPSGARNLYCNAIRNSPHHSVSPVSPRESARKFYVYSPSLDSDCSDSDSRLILRMTNNFQPHNNFNNGLLIISKETPKWIKKVVRRYSNWDFENSSLLSGQSRDDYNIPIEIPLLVQTLNEQHLDMVPEYKVDQVTEMQLIVTQKTFDIDQFVLRRAQQLCAESQLEFLHCEDYDIKIIYVCPLEAYVVCKAVIKLAVLNNKAALLKPETFINDCLFTWNITNDGFEVIESPEDKKLFSTKDYQEIPNIDLPKLNCQSALVMDYQFCKSRTTLRDYNSYYEICLELGEYSVIFDENDVFSNDSE